MAGTLHLLIGPVGSGKSTWARARVVRDPAVFFDVDAWMVRLYGGDRRPEQGVVEWYLERRERCRAQVWEVALGVLECGVDVVLEYGLVGRAEREGFYGRVAAADLPLVVHLFDAPRDERWRRVEARNAAAGPTTQVVPRPFFEAASDAWEPPDAAERTRVRMVDA